MIIKYYCFIRLHMSFIIEENSFCLHKLRCPTHYVLILALVKVTLVVAVRIPASYRCTMLAIRGVVSPCACNASRYCPYIFLKALICSVSRFISICCCATMSTDTARLAANSGRGVPVAAVYVAAAAMLSR